MNSVFHKTNYRFLQSEDIALQVRDKYTALVKDFLLFKFLSRWFYEERESLNKHINSIMIKVIFKTFI